MKRVADNIVVIFWAAVAIWCAIDEAVREDHKRSKLGEAYEGPLED